MGGSGGCNSFMGLCYWTESHRQVDSHSVLRTQVIPNITILIFLLNPLCFVKLHLVTDQGETKQPCFPRDLTNVAWNEIHERCVIPLIGINSLCKVGCDMLVYWQSSGVDKFRKEE